MAELEKGKIEEASWPSRDGKEDSCFYTSTIAKNQRKKEAMKKIRDLMTTINGLYTKFPGIIVPTT